MFTVRLADLLARERAALGDFLVELATFDDRKLWVDLGYASLFDFLHRELRLSKGALGSTGRPRSSSSTDFRTSSLHSGTAGCAS